MAGYQLEFLVTPQQSNYPNPIVGPQEEQITSEVAEFLSKKAIQETQLLPECFVSQIFLVEKKDGARDRSEPETVKSVHESKTLQDGGPPPSSRPNSVRGLDDQTGPKGCISPGSHPPRSPEVPGV